MTFPACYDSQAEFDAWKAFAELAREWSSPCADCTKPHEEAMKGKGRCAKKVVKVAFCHTQKTKRDNTK